MPIHELVPYLSVSDAKAAVTFYSQVFETEPKILLNMPDGSVMHCEFQFGNVRLFLSDELLEHGGTPSPAKLGATSVALHIYVEDCDAMIKRMEEHGASVLMTPEDMFWGERFARARDPFGHEWGIATTLCEMSASEVQEAASKLLGDTSD